MQHLLSFFCEVSETVLQYNIFNMQLFAYTVFWDWKNNHVNRNHAIKGVIK